MPKKKKPKPFTAETLDRWYFFTHKDAIEFVPYVIKRNTANPRDVTVHSEKPGSYFVQLKQGILFHAKKEKQKKP